MTRFPPFPSVASTTRVLVKALIITVIINFICLAADFNPVNALIRINFWGLVGHGRARLMYQSDQRNGQLPIEALIVTHHIAYIPKAADEFRVIVLGNSGPYGASLPDKETLSAQLTQRGIHVDGKRLVAYNLAYPSASVVISTVILDAALRYQPDLVISFVTANMFNNRGGYWDDQMVFFLLNRDPVERIVSRYGLHTWLAPRLSPRPPGYDLVGIHDHGTLTVWLGSLFSPFVEQVVPQTDWRIAQDPVPPEPNNFETVPGAHPVFNETWRFLDIQQDMVESVGARLLIVNQPTLVVDGPHSDVSYSRLYGRAFYDAYYEAITGYTQERGLWFADLWRIVPPDHYTDSELHIDGAGWDLVVDELTYQLDSAYSS